MFERFNFGLGYSPDAIEHIIEERRSAQVRAQEALPLGDRGETAKEQPRSEVGTFVLPTVADEVRNGEVKQHGNSADYLTARIARDRPDILERGAAPPQSRLPRQGWQPAASASRADLGGVWSPGIAP